MHDLTELLAKHGVLLVFLNVLLTQAGLPLPAVPLLIVAGTLVAEGSISPAVLLMAGVSAALLGDTPWFLAGRRYGYTVLRTLCRVAIEPDSCVKRTENIFERYGPVSLVVAKFIPGFATVAPPLAGTMRLDLVRFVLLDGIGALLWVIVPVAAGWYFSREIDAVLHYLETMGARAAVVLLIIVLLYAGVKAVERYLLIRFLRMVRITVGELKALLAGPDEDRPLILDARAPGARRADPRCIPGAIPVDIDAKDLPPLATPDRHVVVYCS